MPTRPPLPRSFIDQHRRERIMRATATLVADRGHAAVTVADIVKEAGIARNTFYETFGSKADAIEATTTWAFEQAIAKVTAAIDPADPLEVRIDLALTAIVDFLTDEPALARTALVDAYAVAPPPPRRRDDAVRQPDGPGVALRRDAGRRGPHDPLPPRLRGHGTRRRGRPTARATRLRAGALRPPGGARLNIRRMIP